MAEREQVVKETLGLIAQAQAEYEKIVVEVRKFEPLDEIIEITDEDGIIEIVDDEDIIELMMEN